MNSGGASPYRRHKNDVELGGSGSGGFEDYESVSDPFDIVSAKSASVDRLKRWRQAALVLNASRRFRYTVDLKKEEERKQIIAKIRTHAQVIRAALEKKQIIAKIRTHAQVIRAALLFRAALLLQAAGAQPNAYGSADGEETANSKAGASERTRKRGSARARARARVGDGEENSHDGGGDEVAGGSGDQAACGGGEEQLKDHSKIAAKYQDQVLVGTDPNKDYASRVPLSVATGKPMLYNTPVTKENTAGGEEITVDGGEITPNGGGDLTAGGGDQAAGRSGGDQAAGGGGDQAAGRSGGGDQTVGGGEDQAAGSGGGDQPAGGGGGDQTANGEERKKFSILKQLDESLVMNDDARNEIYKLIPDNSRFHSQLKLYDISNTLISTLKGKIFTARNTWKATGPSDDLRFIVRNKLRFISNSDLIVKTSMGNCFNYTIRGSRTDRSFLVYRESSPQVVAKVVYDASDINKYSVEIVPTEDSVIFREIVFSVTAIVDAVPRARASEGGNSTISNAFSGLNSLCSLGNLLANVLG